MPSCDGSNCGACNCGCSDSGMSPSEVRRMIEEELKDRQRMLEDDLNAVALEIANKKIDSHREEIEKACRNEIETRIKKEFEEEVETRIKTELANKIANFIFGL